MNRTWNTCCRLRCATALPWARTVWAALTMVCCLALVGCHSPFYADRGAALGGLTGAGLGAAIGNAHGDTALGAVLGGTAGALTGAAVGSSLDEVQARNDAMIQQHLGREIRGATPLYDVIAMSQAGLSDDVIMQHLRVHGLAHPPTAQDLIQLKQQGVSNQVLQALQQFGSPVATVPVTSYPPPPPPPAVLVEEHHYIVPPYHRWPPRPPRYYGPPPRGVHWGVSFGR